MATVQFTREDEATVHRDVLDHKCRLLSAIPGLEMDFDPDEAEQAGAFCEDALSEEDAREAVFDEDPYGEGL